MYGNKKDVTYTFILSILILKHKAYLFKKEDCD